MRFKQQISATLGNKHKIYLNLEDLLCHHLPTQQTQIPGSFAFINSPSIADSALSCLSTAYLQVKFLHPGSLASVQILEESQSTHITSLSAWFSNPEGGSIGVRKIKEVCGEQFLTYGLAELRPSCLALERRGIWWASYEKRCFLRCLLDRLSSWLPFPNITGMGQINCDSGLYKPRTISDTMVSFFFLEMGI